MFDSSSPAPGTSSASARSNPRALLGQQLPRACVVHRYCFPATAETYAATSSASWPV